MSTSIFTHTHWFLSVLRIRIRIWFRICRIHMCLCAPDPEPLVRDTEPDPSIIKQR
jgi:hypothetical protein